jgi:energy-coupling factor transporter ATP-binding protein EcfA2
MSFDIILPFLRPIAALIQDPTVSEVMVNPSGRVFIERAGLLEEVADVAVDERHLKVAVKNIARALGEDISEERPILDSRLPDGSRVAAVFPPCSIGGTTLTIRKFQTRFFTAEELVRSGTMPSSVLVRLRATIARRHNILISGGTSTGKKTLLNALAAFLPPTERVVVIEDTAELQIVRPTSSGSRRDGSSRICRQSRFGTCCGPRFGAARSRGARRGARRGGVRPAPGAQHRACRDAVHHSRELGRAGARAPGVLCGSERGRCARIRPSASRSATPFRCAASAAREGQQARHRAAPRSALRLGAGPLRDGPAVCRWRRAPGNGRRCGSRPRGQPDSRQVGGTLTRSDEESYGSARARQGFARSARRCAALTRPARFRVRALIGAVRDSGDGRHHGRQGAHAAYHRDDRSADAGVRPAGDDSTIDAWHGGHRHVR